MTRTPPKKTKRTKPPEERSNDLLAAARAVFLKRGVAAATVDEITERAGVSKGTFYLYFDSKEEVVGALWQQYIEHFLSIGESALNDVRLEPLPKLIRVFEELTSYVIRNANLHRLVYRSTASLEFSRRNNRQLITMIADVIKAGVASGDLVATDPEVTIRILFHGICGAIHDAIASGDDLDEKLFVETAAELARSTFAPKPMAVSRAKHIKSPNTRPGRSRYDAA